MRLKKKQYIKYINFCFQLLIYVKKKKKSQFGFNQLKISVETQENQIGWRIANEWREPPTQHAAKMLSRVTLFTTPSDNPKR